MMAYAVLRLCTHGVLSGTSIPVDFFGNGMVGFIPVFKTYKEAEAYSDNGKFPITEITYTAE
jgi:hypothetical protein